MNQAVMVRGFLVGMLVVMGASSAVAAEKKKAQARQPAAIEDAKVKKGRKIVEGQVVHVGKRAISVEYLANDAESYEMLLPLSSALRLEGLKELSELKYGDQVKVGIEQTWREVSGSEPVILRTEALVVALVKRATAAPVQAEETVAP